LVGAFFERRKKRKAGPPDGRSAGKMAVQPIKRTVRGCPGGGSSKARGGRFISWGPKIAFPATLTKKKKKGGIDGIEEERNEKPKRMGTEGGLLRKTGRYGATGEH